VDVDRFSLHVDSQPSLFAVVLIWGSATTWQWSSLLVFVHYNQQLKQLFSIHNWEHIWTITVITVKFWP